MKIAIQVDYEIIQIHHKAKWVKDEKCDPWKGQKFVHLFTQMSQVFYLYFNRHFCNKKKNKNTWLEKNELILKAQTSLDSKVKS